MDLENPSMENLTYILEDMAKRLSVVNRSLLNPDDYDLSKYEDIKFMYDVIIQKGSLSAFETQAFIEELRHVRK
ncbi:DUF1128 domain-containing protein [Ornithinibacillus bavariensis]|uniref:Uncharacterized protein n=1 Tax=Ornithinibacillus bavariensis TaxID=545502 RepID=A0A919X571_9BACI|nr:DUF1128 domain-containing protein [Ornithinibacillus bavariensis]GIO26121.1 hypothetical protein J43TS3_07320 [Ornithinibacillus bavariensis]